MRKLLGKPFDSDGDRPIYFTDEGRGVGLAVLRDSLDMVVDIMDACRDEMDDFIESGCGNGIYQGHFMLVKFGLEQAISMVSNISPATDAVKEVD